MINKKANMLFPKLLAFALALGLTIVPAIRAQATQTLLQQGDDLYAQRGDLAKAKEALADTYISLGQIEKARETLEFILTMQPEPELIPETMEEREQARQKLEGKEFRKKK